MPMRKMTIPEFMSTWETGDGSISESWTRHWEKHLPELLAPDATTGHLGDCTKDPCTCELCFLEHTLTEYRKYFFDQNAKLVEDKPKEGGNDA